MGSTSSRAHPCAGAPHGRLALLAAGLSLAACAVEPPGAPFASHEEDSDLVEVGSPADGMGSSFDPDRVMDDAFFTDTAMVDEAGLQVFFERTPYGRSWLADYSVDGQSAAAAIVEASRVQGVNPVAMVARMQVEKSLVSQAGRPDSWSVDFAMGCGCPDGRGCDPARRGLGKQIACAAETLRRHYDGSADGSGWWVRGRSRATLDGHTVTPASHATASLYAYTPWVLVGRGGNWLAWNVTRRFYLHMLDLGVIRQRADGGEPPGEGLDPGDGGPPGDEPPALVGCGDDAGEGARGNDSAAEATLLDGALGVPLRVCDEDEDFFFLDLGSGEGALVTAHFTHEEVDVDMELVDPRGRSTRATSTSDDEALEVGPVAADRAGRYVLRVYAYDRGGAYTLELERR